MKLVRKIFGSIAKKMFFRVPYVKFSAQTLYKTLQACLYMYEISKEQKWIKRAKEIGKLIKKSQLKNGGFDVKYDYTFGSGLNHLKGQALSCETTAITSLLQFEIISGSNEFTNVIQKGINWIHNNSIRLTDSSYTIPYCPEAFSETCILNGVSFASAALGLGIVSYPSIENQLIYERYINFLYQKIEKTESKGFWRYFDSDCSEIDSVLIEKIDYYHLAQQVEIHSIAQKYNPINQQKEMILLAANFIVALHEKYGIVPYDNKNFFGGHIHSWGLSSIIPGMIEAATIHLERYDDYMKVATETAEWLLSHAWSGEYFYDILTIHGIPVSKDYMVRSDAWCLQAFAKYYAHSADERFKDVVEICYKKIEINNFSGKEKHARSKFQTYLQKFQKR